MPVHAKNMKYTAVTKMGGTIYTVIMIANYHCLSHDQPVNSSSFKLNKSGFDIKIYIETRTGLTLLRVASGLQLRTIQ